MKPSHFAFLAVFSALCACTPIDPAQPEPAPKPIPAQNGPYLVRSLDSDGKTIQEWDVSAYTHTFFPKSLVFQDSTGKMVKLTGSFEVVKKP